VNITRLAIDYNRVTWVVFFLVVIAGINIFNHMPRAYDPGFIVRTAQVLTYFPGASPERVEQLVSSKIEDAVKEIPELDFVQSESRTGVSVVLVNIKESYTDMRPIWDDLRRKMDDVVNDLPEGVNGPFVEDEFGDVYGIVMTMQGEGLSYAELDDIADDIKDELQEIDDVAKVEIWGRQEERIFVEYNNARLSELGISPYQLSQILSDRNIVSSGGDFNLGLERISLEPTGNFESLADIRDMIIPIPGKNQLIKLRYLANIKTGYVDPPSSMVHSSGKKALGFAISMRDGGNNIELGDAVKAKIEGFNAAYPYGVEFDLVNFLPAEVDRKVSEFVRNLGQAIAVVTVVMLLSLGLRTGLVVAVLIPTTLLMSLIFMNLFDIGLDQISLAALIIALGMLVDNGIVMSENTLVQMEQGVPRLDAALHSAEELRLPLLTASLTTGAAFLPIYLAESAVGEFTAALFKVVTITLLCSWFISLTFIPLVSVNFLKVKSGSKKTFGKLQAMHGSILAFLLNHRTATLLVTAVVFALGMASAKYVPKLFFPLSDRQYFLMDLELPTGYAIDSSEAVVNEFEQFLADNLQMNEARATGITNWVSYVGNSGPRFILNHIPQPSSANIATIIANVTDASEIPKYFTQIEDYAARQFPDLTLRLKMVGSGPGVPNPVEIRLSSRDLDKLFPAVEMVRLKMRQHPGLQNITDDWGQRIKKLKIEIDQVRAQRAGVTSRDIATSLQTGLTGMELTEYRKQEDTIPVVLRTTAAANLSINKIESLSVYSQSSGKSVPLSQVASVLMEWDIAQIHRRDGIRTVTIGGQLQGNANADLITQELDQWLAKEPKLKKLGVSYEYGGEYEISGTSNESIAAKVGIAGMIILLILVVQFNSIRKPLIIISTIPLGLVGVFWGLLITNSYIGFMTILGVVSLAGIVINNAIVLLEKIQIDVDEGVDHYDAIINAAQQRARPILLTTTTTVLGLMPLYYGGGAMWEPMALAIMAGLIFSTILTLGVIPVIYATLFRVHKQAHV